MADAMDSKSISRKGVGELQVGFVAAAQSGCQSMTGLCARFSISRKTSSKLLRRYEDGGPGGLRDRSRAPRVHPNQTAPELERAILRVRKAHPTWGAKKILAVLERG